MRLDTTAPAMKRDRRPHKVDGFNLLPWRPREMQRQRRRRVVEWGAAALVGCACATPLAGWQAWERGRFDARRLAVEASAAQLRVPFAEAQRLIGAVTAQRSAVQLAQQRGKPLTRTLALLDRLASAGTPGVALQQIVQHGYETELQAAVANETATAEWLGRLRAVPDVETVSVRELKRAVRGGNSKERASISEPIRLIARLVWQATPVPATSAKGGPREEVRNPE
ncbi:fimbrial assembly protein [Paraburkholderia dinghuensis]|uniref:Fimbrial assembly protein n=1 Tax=Paraburkholderia dinghuensis TaxID=2305225 RepID=A0A3N6PTE4_9BURK|nr:fimbrial assembly protein [Paraburkholderia dinghuensis]RQH02916.1 fimbrial assembly protein [Paraburkholderia dinghuensis]